MSDHDFLSIALNNAGIGSYRIWVAPALVSMGPSLGDRGNISKNDEKRIDGLGIFDTNFNDLTLISPLVHISYLDLRGNKIKMIRGLDSLKKLKYIDLSNNPINLNDATNKKEIEKLRARGVEVIL